MFLLRWMSRWPLGLLHGLGALAGWLAFCLSRSYGRRLWQHARAAGASRWQAWQAAAAAGKMLFEIPWLWLRPVATPLGRWVQWEGVERLDALLAQGKGLLLMTPHMGCFEITAQAFAQRYGAQHPITVLFRPAKKPWLRELVAASRNRPGLEAAPATLAGVRHMLRALKGGQCVGLLPDQVPPEGLGLWAPFFGRPAYTMTLAARLLLQTKAPVALLWGERLSWGRGFCIHVREFPAPPPEATLDHVTLEINRAMEGLILEAPQQYLWGYNRYKGPRPLDLGDLS
ncbi:lysophospholipid acyltransferase family protein [Inhella gelatinilytica]|uniref:Lysophospholipid acyltransferase family protein n=1 Tax=Inhella gelatinilytica TaxID=2795030 RepID=A0A931IYK2_9BURK|nr:lysophospholipid acyltransferase family protein [Inhella gelatinilytica]MBH9552196.1 lysophospholipid acyltransferase family protein [Inhella gelatinilytica]